VIGTTLGHYRITDKLGEGGMGVVYRAHDPRLDRDVAIKVLREEVAQNPDRVARFEREARAVAALSHPNILAIFDFGAEGGTAYAVTELLEGESLHERLAREKIGMRKAVEIGASIADGLAAAHAKGIIHRDLKPGNIFLTTEGRVKILDFGLPTTKPRVSQHRLPKSGALWEPWLTCHPSKCVASLSTTAATFFHLAVSFMRWRPAAVRSVAKRPPRP
jgi:serine/threonine protein kinase